MASQPDGIHILRDDLIRFEHIIDAAGDLLELTKGRSRSDLDTNMMLRRAVIHAIQEIGEASSRVTLETRKHAPTLPWVDIIRMRNVVVHVYWGVDLDRVWHAATVEVSALVATVQTLLDRSIPYEED